MDPRAVSLDEARKVDSEEELAAQRIGQVVGGRWTLERVLGVGGMAAVYAAREPGGTVAALKLLHPDMAVRRDVRERFLREGYVANSIERPGVVRALEHGDGASEVYLAMELLVGETLAARVKRHGRLPVDEILDYAEQILEVLAVAHDKGIVHRDLKPDNLFVTVEGQLKVLDFGLARLMDGVPGGHKTRTGLAVGTLPYMPPEQALGRREQIDGRVDIFALGATMFRILAGRRVHEAESEAELLMAMASKPALPLKTVAPEVPEVVASVVDLALAFSRDARYPDARTMLADVRAARRGEPPPYAVARLSAREEATRTERMAPQQKHVTVPLAAYQPPEGPGERTQPLAPTVSAPPGPAFEAHENLVGPPSTTAPMSTGAPISMAAPMSSAAPFSVPAPISVAAPQSYIPTYQVVAGPVEPPAQRRGRWVAIASLLALFLIAGGAAAWMLTEEDEPQAELPAALPPGTSVAAAETATAAPPATEAPAAESPVAAAAAAAPSPAAAELADAAAAAEPADAAAAAEPAASAPDAAAAAASPSPGETAKKAAEAEPVAPAGPSKATPTPTPAKTPSTAPAPTTVKPTSTGPSKTPPAPAEPETTKGKGGKGGKGGKKPK